ncbi:hypothetical protein SNARM312S_02979 [Streptomyces narbonensis]
MAGGEGDRDLPADLSASLPAGRASGLLGKEIAGYLVESEIGRGGMAVVYRARDLRLDRTVALKLLAPELARNDTFRKRFAHESRVAASIDHPHIVPVFDAGETEGVLYIAMRYVAGQDLVALLDREGPLAPATAGGSPPRWPPPWTRRTRTTWCTGT